VGRGVAAPGGTMQSEERRRQLYSSGSVLSFIVDASRDKQKITSRGGSSAV